MLKVKSKRSTIRDKKNYLKNREQDIYNIKEACDIRGMNNKKTARVYLKEKERC